MKKLFTVLLTVIMIAAAVPAGARSSFAPNGTGWDPDEVITVKKADPANVVKDGVIGKGEYERYYADLDMDDEMTSPLFLVAFGADSLDHVMEMFPTMEYYFSWDEEHGFNFAIRNRPPVIQQVLGVLEGESPHDDFCKNLAYIVNFETDSDVHPILYYALAKRTDTGEYLEGYYVNPGRETQLGAKNTYDPEPLRDYIITYDYETGYAMIEWSIPFEDINAAPTAAGSTFKLTISATGGTAVDLYAEHDAEDCYAVTLGDKGYGVNIKQALTTVTYVISDEEVAASGDTPSPSPDPDQVPDPDPAPAPVVNPDPEKYEVTKDDEGNDIVVDKETGEKVDVLPAEPARTGDPMIITAAAAALSAAGAFIVRRKRKRS